MSLMGVDWPVVRDVTRTIAACVAAAGAIVAAIGVYIARRQLEASRNQARTDFEDELSREYRRIAREIPTKAFFGEDLSESEHAATLDEFFYYVDLCNEQVFLRWKGRVSKDTWKDWCDGIRQNLALPAFQRAWGTIKTRMPDSFTELRRLEASGFQDDPRGW